VDGAAGHERGLAGAGQPRDTLLEEPVRVFGLAGDTRVQIQRHTARRLARRRAHDGDSPARGRLPVHSPGVLVVAATAQPLELVSRNQRRGRALTGDRTLPALDLRTDGGRKNQKRIVAREHPDPPEQAQREGRDEPDRRDTVRAPTLGG